ncbi:related to Glycerol-3-phosphate O-acyltransferase 2 [Zygosaccharomyces bailii ISA1307]|nr:related to Glycerol-3-phosphate O-acyltransferase 2 [Zygosaccharomyces bailii ISA1307]
MVKDGKSNVHVPQLSRDYPNPFNGDKYGVRAWLYDCVIVLLDVLFSIFFREIKVRGEHKLPPKGTPMLLVCAPHANQFIDPALVMTKARQWGRGDRSRQVCFITAESSLKKKFIGLFGWLTGAIPVPRAQDNLEYVDERILIYAPDLDKNPRLIKGRVLGEGLASPGFTKFVPKSLIGLPNYLGNAQIEDIPDDYTIVLKQPFRFQAKPAIRTLLEKGTRFKYAAKVNNSRTFQNVFDHLHTRGCVGIFPEGGSHDRPSMLPVKAGVAIMALGATAAEPTMKVAAVPCGLHYFHREKFRSRAVLEFGDPIWIDGAMGKQYTENPRETVSHLLDKITNSLYLVTENAPDWDTLMTIQAVRRLYKPVMHRRALTAVVEVNRRLLMGYSAYKDDPRVVRLKKMVTDYDAQLYSFGLKDHQVPSLRTKHGEELRCLLTLVQRIIRLTVFFILSLPGCILFAPIFLVCNAYSKKKQREGLKKSVVKLKGIDLLATWKLLVALVLAPVSYMIYAFVLTWLYVSRNTYAQHLWVPSHHYVVLFVYFYGLLVLMTYASLKTGEVGVDLFKSLPPLFVSLFYPGSKLMRLKKMRESLSDEITEVCNELGPQVFPNFHKIIESQYKDEKPRGRPKLPGFTKSDDEITTVRSRSSSVSSSHSGLSNSLSNSLSQINSRGSLTDMPILSEGRHTDATQEDEIDFSLEPQEDDKIAALTRQRRAHEKDD